MHEHVDEAPGGASRRKSPGRRLLGLGLGLVLTFALLEGGLQIASLFVEGSRAGAAGDSFVLCQGDSHTFGLYMPTESSYPAQLEALLRERGVDGARVVNRGLPGKTTWVVRAELPADLATYRPRAIVVLAGTNNRWRERPDEAQLPSSGDPAPASAAVAEAADDGFALEDLRTVKLARLFLDRRANPEQAGGFEGEGDVPFYFLPDEAFEQAPDGSTTVSYRDRTGELSTFTLASGDPSREEMLGGVTRDVAVIAELARAQGARPVVLGYPTNTSGKHLINLAIAEAAEAAGVRFVDPRPAFAEAEALVGGTELTYNSGHPTRLGYSIVARLVLQALVEEGLVEEAGPIDPLEEVRAFDPPEFEVEALREDGAVAGFRARYMPGYGAGVFLSGSRGTCRMAVEKGMRPVFAGPDEPGFEVPLAADAVLRTRLRNWDESLPMFDRDASLEIPLPASSPPPAAGEERWAVVLLLSPARTILDASEPVRVFP